MLLVTEQIYLCLDAANEDASFIMFQLSWSSGAELKGSETHNVRNGGSTVKLRAIGLSTVGAASMVIGYWLGTVCTTWYTINGVPGSCLEYGYGTPYQGITWSLIFLVLGFAIFIVGLAVGALSRFQIRLHITGISHSPRLETLPQDRYLEWFCPSCRRRYEASNLNRYCPRDGTKLSPIVTDAESEAEVDPGLNL